jgi:hypothetical protein
MMRRRILPAALFVYLMSTLAGCLLTGTLNDKGGGTLLVKIRLTSEAQLQQRKLRMQSAAVKVTNASIDKDNWATYELAFDDVTKLSTTEHFQHTKITLTDGPDGTKQLTIKSTNPTPHKLNDEAVAYFGNQMTIAITLPGDIVKSNATSTDKRTATWSYQLRDFVAAKESTLEVAFKAGAAQG